MLELHTDTRHFIDNQLEHGAQVFVLLGDRGIGKRSLCKQLAWSYGMLREYPKLGVDGVRELRDLCLRASSSVDVYVFDGDQVTRSAWNALLKLLEEPPANRFFFLCCSVPPPVTVVSRAVTCSVKKLDRAELIDVLKFKGMSQSVAESLVPFADGSVEQAYKAYETLESKKQLIAHLKCLQESDKKAALAVAAKLTKSDIELLRELMDELLMARYGLKYEALIELFSASPAFLGKVRQALLMGSNPTLCWLRAWYATREFC